MSVKPLVGVAKLPYIKLPAETSAEPKEQFDLIDGTLTVRENEEFFINCVVESSKPAASIIFSSNSDSPSTPDSNALSSVLSSNSNVFRNVDHTLKTVFSARLKANLKDHGKVITCKADNGFSNQKWENKKVLNILCKFFFFQLFFNSND